MAEAQQLAQALLQAASSAAAAVDALRQAQADRGAPQKCKFTDAGKMVRMPDPFSAVGADEEQSKWPDFILNLKAWLFAADSEFEADLTKIEDHVLDEMVLRCLGSSPSCIHPIPDHVPWRF